MFGGANLEYGAVRRFPMRGEAAWHGQPGLPHGTVAYASRPARVCRPRWGRVQHAIRRLANLEVYATDAFLSPSPRPRPAATPVPSTGRRFAGGGARARGHGLAADRIHQPPQGQWGLAAWGRERRRERVERGEEMFWAESTWSTAPSAVFPCGGRRRGTVSPGSRTARRRLGV
jgi:hypothetical protein